MVLIEFSRLKGRIFCGVTRLWAGLGFLLCDQVSHLCFFRTKVQKETLYIRLTIEYGFARENLPVMMEGDGEELVSSPKVLYAIY